MAQATLTVQLRDKSVKAKDIRKMKMIPAEYYGRGVENISLQMNYQDFRRLYRTAGMNTVIDLKIEGKGDKNVIVHRVDTDTVTDDISYVELVNVRMDEEITADVPLRLEGQSLAVRDLGAILIQNLDTVEVTCLPAKLPHEIVVSIEGLVDLNSSVHVRDIAAPAGVKINTDPEESVISLTMPQEEVVEETPVDVSAVEVTTEKKDGEEGAAPAEKKEE
jgi:large subunit ribosomal protein L25